MEQNFALRMDNICKHFPGVKALDNVSLELKKGEILSLLGENGAGKSTLLKILAGVYIKDSGKIVINGEDCVLNSPRDAIELGISVIYQELSYVNDLTVAENIFINRYPRKAFGLIDWDKMISSAAAILNNLDIEINPGSLMSNLSVAEKQMVEIAKAVSQDMKILVTDEPTSAITDHEVEHLFKLFRNLKKKDVAIIFISHKLEEVMAISDTIMVLRDGKNQGRYDVDKVTKEELVSHMIGRNLDNFYPDKEHESGGLLLSVEGITTEILKNPVSFEVHEGEVLGIYGLMGSGITEIGEAVFGLSKTLSGDIKFSGKSLKHANPKVTINNSIAYIPAERKKNGMIGCMSVLENMAIPDLVINRRFLLDHEKDRRRSGEWIEKFRIKTPERTTVIETLSGGNQQKVILSKWLDTAPRLLILNEPTRGIDIGAKAEIYRFIEDYCRSGGAVILISSELPEICSLSDYYLIMHQGKLQEKVYGCEELDETGIMSLAMGLNGE